MKAISQDQFVEKIADALPRMMAAIMENDDSAVSKGVLSLPQFWALHYLNEHEQMTVNELATALGRKNSSVSGLVNRMVRSGLVKRTRSESDRRVVYLSLTPKSRKVVNRLIENRKEGIRKTYAALTGSERTQYLQLMEKILKGTRFVVLALLFSSSIVCFASEPIQELKTYTLEESIRLGLKRSVSVANALRNQEIAEMKKIEARSDGLPKIRGIADYSRFDSENIVGTSIRNVGAEASMQIFAGGRTMAAVRAAKAFDLLTVEQIRRIRAAQIRDIAYGYNQVLLAKAEVSVLEQSVEQLEVFEKETREKFDAGTASEFDWLSARVKLRNEKPRLIRARNYLKITKETFRNLTYMEDTEFELSDPLAYHPYKVDLEKSIECGLVNRPELLEQTRFIELQKENVNKSRSSYYPRVDLFGDYKLTDPDPYSFITEEDGWQSHWTMGIRASWDLFDGGLRHSALGQSKLELAIEEDNLIDLERAIKLEIRTQWFSVRDSEEAIHATMESIELAQRALDIAEVRYDSGLGTQLEFSQANLELSNARLSRNIALRAHQDAVIGLKYATGILLKEYDYE